MPDLHAMQRGAFLLLVVLFSGLAPAQDPSLVPGLLDALNGPLSDTARAQVLVKLCFNLTLSDPSSARDHGMQGLALAQGIKHEKSIADAYNNLGWLALAQGRTQEADSLLQLALERFERMKAPAFVSVVRSNMGWSAERQGDRVGALRHFRAALELAEAARDSGNVAVLLYNIGTTYNKMEEFARARDHFERSLAMEQAWADRPDKQGICFLGIANTYRSQGDTSQALRNYANAEQLFERIGDEYHSGLVAENTGALFETKDPATAVRYYGKALAAYRALNAPNDEAYVLLALGNLYRRTGDLHKSEGALSAGAALARRSGDIQLVMEYEYAMADLAGLQGDGRVASEHFKRFIALSDSLRNAGTEKELMRLRTEFETERAEKDNELLRLKDQENTERLRARNLQLYGSLALATLALGAVVLVWRNLHQRRKHQVILEGLNTELRDQKARIEEVNGLLRLKVLRTQMDPHFIHNCLNAIKALSLAGEHTKAEEYLDGFARLLRQVLEHSVRDSITLEEELDFLRNYVKLEGLRMKGAFTWTVEADQQLIDEGMLIPSLLVQPFVENAVWHGLAPKEGAKDLSVRFSIEGDGVRCLIEDNGVGRSVKATTGRSSLGLKLTGERLQLLTQRMEKEGAFVIEDLKDDAGAALGTRVVLKLAGTSA